MAGGAGAWKLPCSHSVSGHVIMDIEMDVILNSIPGNFLALSIKSNIGLCVKTTNGLELGVGLR
jgi:hypothetical protein